MSELVSIILPVYNGEKFIKKSIDSLLNQSYKNFELIIINDGSTDNSDLIIKNYLPNHKIKYYSRENQGLVVTLNEAIKKCKGNYIARMDQDDICYPNRIEKQLDFLIENDLDICGTSYEVVNENEKVLKVVKTFKKNFEIIISAMLVPFAHPSIMFRNLFQSENLSYGNGHTLFAEDYDLWIKMINKRLRFGNLDDILIKYRISSNSMTKTNKIQIFKEVYNKSVSFNKENKLRLLVSYENILLCGLNRDFAEILVKSMFNFMKSNGIDYKLIKLMFNINIHSLFIGFLKFLKQEFSFMIYSCYGLNSK